MTKSGIARLFRNGSSQAVRLPREFRFDGDRVRIRQVAKEDALEPVTPDAFSWFEKLDQFKPDVFMDKTRRQPITPKRRIFK